jgi:hypothetical protein
MGLNSGAVPQSYDSHPCDDQKCENGSCEPFICFHLLPSCYILDLEPGQALSWLCGLILLCFPSMRIGRKTDSDQDKKTI